jgi:hypothetical protein
MTASTSDSRPASSSGSGIRYGIPASAILRLARVIRCPTVDSGTRKARAICAVVRPHTARSVSAICPVRGRAGWQQVNSSRSRSSGSGWIGHCSSASLLR